MAGWTAAWGCRLMPGAIHIRLVSDLSSTRHATPPQKGQKMRALFALLWLPNLAPSERTIGAWLVWHANGSNGRCDPGQSRLRNETGLSRRAIIYALNGLAEKGIIAKHLRGTRSTSYRINWTGLDDVVARFETHAKRPNRDAPENGRVQGLAQGGAEDCTSEAQGLAPKPVEENFEKELVFPVDIEQGSMRENEASEDDDIVGRKLLAAREDRAFVFALRDKTRAGKRFRSDIADAMYERLDRIKADGDHSDPVVGIAYEIFWTGDLAA